MFVPFVLVLGMELIVQDLDHRHPFFDKVPSLPSVPLVVVRLIHSVLVAVVLYQFDLAFLYLIPLVEEQVVLTPVGIVPFLIDLERVLLVLRPW